MVNNMSNKTKNKKVAFILDGIDKDHSDLWNRQVLELINSKNVTCYINHNAKSNKINKICEGKELVTLENCNSIINEETIVWWQIPTDKNLRTKYSSKVNITVLKEIKYERIDGEISRIRESDFDYFITDKFPSELSNNLSEINLQFTANRFIFCPPLIDKIQVSNKNPKEIIIIQNNNNNNISKTSVFASILTKNEKVQTIIVNNDDFFKEINNIRISKDTKLVLCDLDNISHIQYLSLFCLNLNIELKLLSHICYFSPERAYLDFNERIRNWLPKESLNGLRQEYKYLLKDRFSANNNAEIKRFDYTIENTLSLAQKKDPEKEFMYDLFKITKCYREIYSKKYHEELLGIILKLNKELEFQENRRKSFSLSLIFLFKFYEEGKVHQSFSEFVVYYSNKILAKENIFHGKRIFSYLFNKNPDLFINSFIEYEQTISDHIYIHLSDTVQTSLINQDSKENFYNWIKDEKCLTQIKFAFHLSKSVDDFLLAMSKSILPKGTCGRSVLYCIFENCKREDETLTSYISLCKKEISNNCSNSITYYALFILNIITKDDNEIFSFSDTSSKEFNFLNNIDLLFNCCFICYNFKKTKTLTALLPLLPKVNSYKLDNNFLCFMLYILTGNIRESKLFEKDLINLFNKNSFYSFKSSNYIIFMYSIFIYFKVFKNENSNRIFDEIKDYNSSLINLFLSNSKNLEVNLDKTDENLILSSSIIRFFTNH